jgi:anti-sigma factor RsiW
MKQQMTCRDGVTLLLDYLDGLLDRPRRRSVEAHVAGCPRCQKFVRSYAETPRIVRDATAFDLPERVSAALHRRLKRRA